jgi:hypothetical protein
VQRRQLTAKRQQVQPRATFKKSPLVAGQAMLAQGIPAFGAERALGVDGFDIGLDERKRFLALPRPMRRIEASALFAGTAGCWCVAFQEVSEGVGGEVNAVLGEVAGEALASVVGFLVALPHALLYVGVGFSGLAFWGFGQVVQCLLAVLLVAFDPLAHALWGGVVSWCGFAVVLGLLVDVDDAFACLDGVRGVYLLIGKFHRWRAFCCARC